MYGLKFVLEVFNDLLIIYFLFFFIAFLDLLRFFY